jgi:protein-S-isoprenylcysteine O-methyltransferase Ste14
VSFALAIGALAVECVGVAIAIWAREHLGRLWSGRVTLKEGHRIIRSGPYRFVRHPIYTGLLVGISGVVMVRGTLSAAVALLLFVIGVTRKILAEERLMTEQFGDEYRQYKKDVKALIPFLV